MRSSILIIILVIFFTACIHKKEAVVNKDIYYTCSMHPQVHSDGPGKCPICSMDLIPVNTRQAASKGEIELSDEQIKLANIKTDTLRSGGSGTQKILTGTVVINEKENSTISSRVMGRIDKLYYRNEGDYIPKGVKIYELYSEELNTAKQEFVLLMKKRKSLDNNLINFDQLINSARSKLQLWGLTPGQISTLQQTQKAPLLTSYYSLTSGFITNVLTSEGAYITEGQPIFKLSNTSSVWVEVQVYTSELQDFSTHGNVLVSIPGLNNKTYTGKIEFANPVINPANRINILRVSIANPQNELKPGMLALINIKSPIQQGFTLPNEAIINNQDMQSVWLKTSDHKFKYQMITTGKENGGSIQINSGLKSGDIVVTSGAYLLNSEFKLRNGTNPMAGMKM